MGWTQFWRDVLDFVSPFVFTSFFVNLSVLFALRVMNGSQKNSWKLQLHETNCVHFQRFSLNKVILQKKPEPQEHCLHSTPWFHEIFSLTFALSLLNEWFTSILVKLQSYNRKTMRFHEFFLQNNVVNPLWYFVYACWPSRVALE